MDRLSELESENTKLRELLAECLSYLPSGHSYKAMAFQDSRLGERIKSALDPKTDVVATEVTHRDKPFQVGDWVVRRDCQFLAGDMMPHKVTAVHTGSVFGTSITLDDNEHRSSPGVFRHAFPHEIEGKK